MSRCQRVARRALLVCSMLMLAGQAFAEARTFDLAVQAGELPPDVRVIRVRQGDDVTLRWTADGPLTIHLHGYDIEKTVPVAGEPTIMRFTARATGRFPIEVHRASHGQEKTLGYLEVHPR
jgi:FtsP/CotA-like multicopper oxidase with cupredoxin domain